MPSLMPPAQQLQPLPVMESFYTLQGEGFHQGKAAYFIRLAGCGVGCIWCDVKESWDAAKYAQKNIKEITADALSTIDCQLSTVNCKPVIVITGGEPLMHNLDELTASLQAAGLKTHIETSGAYPLSGTWNWICLSPKKFKAPLPGIIPLASELKIIVFNKSDFKWAEEYAAKVSPSCKLYLQPEWGKAKDVTPLIIEYIKANPKWELSLQIHKYINVP